MTTRRVIIGKRSNGDAGVFVSPVGIDAYTALDSQLILGIASSISQLVMMGQVYATTTIALGLTRSPYVFVTSHTVLGLPGSGVNLDGPMRPSPLFSVTQDGDNVIVSPKSPSYATINGNGASMTIGAPQKTYYQVYNRAFT